MTAMRWKSGVLLAVAAGAAWAGKLEPLSSAELCGRCHRAILDAWKSSAHARAMESQLFQSALELAETDFGEQAARACPRHGFLAAAHFFDRVRSLPRISQRPRLAGADDLLGVEEQPLRQRRCSVPELSHGQDRRRGGRPKDPQVIGR